jgi:hypothetical protein
LSENITRHYFKDDWHCDNPPNHNCGCWRTKDVERDKKMIAQRLTRIDSRNIVEVSYNEWKRDPEAGSESRDRNVYYAHIRERDFEGLKPDKRISVYMPEVWELMWHGLELVGIWTHIEKGRPVLVLEFEREGIYVHETEHNQSA